MTFRATDAQPWTFADAGLPPPGGAHPRINLWLREGNGPDSDTPVTVIIESFDFTPHSA